MTSTELKSVILAVVLSWTVSIFTSEFSAWNIFTIIPALLLMFPFTSWIHSPAHGSLNPRWLNRPVGELMGFIQLTGFPDWHILHVFHHQFPDHPELDPHPPMQNKYWEFALGMRAQIGKCYMNHYFKYFGKNEISIQRMGFFLKAAKLNMFMKVSFWYLALGPQYFSFFFTTSILLNASLLLVQLCHS